MSAISAVGFFLMSLVFGLILYALWLRVFVAYLRMSVLHPFSKLIHALTDPLITPLNRLFKLKYKPGQAYDWVAIAFIVLIEFIKIMLISLSVFHKIMPMILIVLYVVADLIIQPCDILFYALLIRVIMSFANPGWQHPVADFVQAVTEPLLRWGRRIVPDISGFDFSPFVILIILKIISLFISASLPWRLL